MSGFKLASLNVTSLVKHIEELRILLANNMIGVLAINETRLAYTVSDDEVHIHGYEIVRRDRESNGIDFTLASILQKMCNYTHLFPKRCVFIHN